MPEELFGKFKKNILPQWKVCFFSGLIVGLITHLYKLTNWLPNWDSLVFRHDPQNMLSLGRWFLLVASAPSSFYDLPWLAGLMTLLFYSLGAVYICKMFSVQKKMTAGIIGAAVVSFPNVTSVLMYNYVADAYALSFFLACIAAYLMSREKPGYITAAILIALSVGIYQAYLTVTIMLLLCCLIRDVFRKDMTGKALLIKSVRLLLTGALGLALYYGILVLSLKISGVTLVDYQGLNDAAALSGIDIWKSLYVVKETFFSYFFDFGEGIHVFGVVNGLIFFSIVLFYFVELIKKKPGLMKFLLLCVYVVCLPMGACALCFINSDVDYHNLMKMGYFMFYLLFILQYEHVSSEKANVRVAKSWAILAVMSVLIFNQVVIANVSYHTLNMAYQKSYGILIRIADRIEQTEGATECDRILVLGALPDSHAYSADLLPNITGTTDGLIIRADDEQVGQSVLCSALNDYCSKDYSFLAGEEKRALIEKYNLADLDNWPEKESICVVDDVIVIKLGD